MDIKQALGAHIRHHRRLQGMSQETLAELTEVPVEIIGKIERGTAEATFATVEKIAVALILPPLALFGVPENATPQSERDRLLAQINAILTGMSDEQIGRAAKMLEVFAGG